MAKTTEKTMSALEKYIPSDIIKLTDDKIRDIVKNTDSDTLHKKFNELNFLYNSFVKSTKEELIERIKKSDSNNIETEIGIITLNTRTDIKVEDETLLEKNLSKLGIDIHEIYDEDYVLVNKNPKVINTLLKKGIITKVYNLNRDKLKIALKKYEKLAEFVKIRVTEFLKGL